MYKYSIIIDMPCSKPVKYEIMSNASIKDTVKTAFLIGLDTIKLKLQNISK